MDEQQTLPVVVRGKEVIPLNNTAGLNLRNRIALSFYGKTISDVVAKQACISCQGPATKFTDEISLHQYLLSGLCQQCQDAVFNSL